MENEITWVRARKKGVPYIRESLLMLGSKPEANDLPQGAVLYAYHISSELEARAWYLMPYDVGEVPLYGPGDLVSPVALSTT